MWWRLYSLFYVKTPLMHRRSSPVLGTNSSSLMTMVVFLSAILIQNTHIGFHDFKLVLSNFLARHFQLANY
ncbi:hypothetical protein BDW75DRAFT_202499 [Aspergillus navahoensis]